MHINWTFKIPEFLWNTRQVPLPEDHQYAFSWTMAQVRWELLMLVLDIFVRWSQWLILDLAQNHRTQWQLKYDGQMVLPVLLMCPIKLTNNLLYNIPLYAMVLIFVRDTDISLMNLENKFIWSTFLKNSDDVCFYFSTICVSKLLRKSRWDRNSKVFREKNLWNDSYNQMRVIDAGSWYLFQMEPVAHFGFLRSF